MDKPDFTSKIPEPKPEIESRPPAPLGRKTVGRYEVLYPLAQGGMASVHVGRLVGYAGIDHLVAIKVIHPHLAGDPSFNEMLLDEARLAGLIGHPNVCSVLEVGEDNGLLYLICELIMGQNLRTTRYRAQNQGLSIPQTLLAHIGCEICSGLHQAHEQEDKKNRPLNLVHRDVTPRNIIVSYDGYVKLIDFGIALARGRIVQTDAGDKKGKIGYMPPEQIHGKGIDRRTDIFALGVVLYQMAVGVHPFPGETEAERTMRVLSGGFNAPRLANPEIHPALEKIIVKAMSTNPADRFQSAQQMGKELQAFAFGVTGEAGIAAIRSLMHELFEKEIEEDESTLQQHRNRAARNVPPPPLVSGNIQHPAIDPPPAAAKPTPLSFGPRTTKRQNFRFLMGTSLSLLLVILGLTIAGRHLMFSGHEPANINTTDHNENHAEPGSTVSPRQINLTLKLKPEDATVTLDGKRLPPRTTMTSLPLDQAEHILVIAAPGYQTFERRFKAIADYHLIIDLTPGNGSRRNTNKNPAANRPATDPSLRSNPYEQ